MDNTNQKNGITPPNADKSPDTCKTSKYPSDLNLNLFKALFPYADFSAGVDMALSDAHVALKPTVSLIKKETA